MTKTDDGWFSEDTATFGDRLAGAREGAGLTQSALAERLGVKLGTLIGWENDIKEPRANRLQMLSGILGVSLPWMLTGHGEGPEGPADETPLPLNVSDLMTELRALRTEMLISTEKLARLEKRLRTALKDMP